MLCRSMYLLTVFTDSFSGKIGFDECAISFLICILATFYFQGSIYVVLVVAYAELTCSTFISEAATK